MEAVAVGGKYCPAGGNICLRSGPKLFDRVEASLPELRERVFSPTETRSMLLAQARSADGKTMRGPARVNLRLTRILLRSDTGFGPKAVVYP